MEKIILKDDVEQYLKKLSYTLYKKEYFGYMATSIEYVQRLRDDIEKYIDIKQHVPTTGRLKKYGKYYASFPANKRTTWYVFFNKNKGRYVIRYILNNHGPKAALLRDLL